MTNYAYKKIESKDEKYKKYAVLTSIELRDLERIKILANIVLDYLNKRPETLSLKECAICDACYTTIFIKYRRCFDSSRKKSQLEMKDVPEVYKKLHDYIQNMANKYYAHAVDETNSVFHVINSDTKKITRLDSGITDPFAPLDKRSLEQLCKLVDVFISKIRDEKNKISI